LSQFLDFSNESAFPSSDQEGTLHSDFGLSWDTAQGNLSPSPITNLVDSEVNPAFREGFSPRPQSFLSPVMLTSSPSLPSSETQGYPRLDGSIECPRSKQPLSTTEHARSIPQSAFESCGHCGKRFRDTLPLKQHIAAKHSDKSYTCVIPTCRVFTNLRSLNRHLKTATVHLTHGSPRFQCRCGHSNPRKDHHTRHLTTTQCQGNRPYMCWCGRRDVDRVQHEKHYKPCNRGKRGRPPKQEKKSNAGKENI